MQTICCQTSVRCSGACSQIQTWTLNCGCHKLRAIHEVFKEVDVNGIDGHKAMDELLRGWRRKCGIGMLFAALVLTGAWVKSVYDHPGGRDPDEQVAEWPSMSGKIGISGYRLPIEKPAMPVSQNHWSLFGLYTDAELFYSTKESISEIPDSEPCAPAELNELTAPSPPDENPLVAAAIEGIVVPAAHLEPDRSGEEVSDRAMPPSFELTPEQGPQPWFSYLDLADCTMLHGVVFSEATDDSMKVTSNWQCCGFCFLCREGADGSWDGGVLVPHWSIVAPLLLLSVALFRQSLPARSAILHPRAMSATTPQQPPIDKHCETGDRWSSRRRNPGILTSLALLAAGAGWHGKLALVTLFASIVLTAGWIRSRVVSDLFRFDVGADANVLLLSGWDGITLQHECGCGVGWPASYQTFTGKRHQELTYRPKRDFERQFEQFMLEHGNPDGSFNLPTFDASDPEETMPNSPQVAVLNPSSGETIAATSGQQTANVAPRTGSGTSPWTGISFDWAGFYMDDTGTPRQRTVVVPYGFLVLPLALSSTVLLVRSCAIRGDRDATGTSRAPGILAASE